MKKDFYIFALMVLVAVLIALNVRQCSTGKRAGKAWEAITDTLKTEIDNKGRQIASLRVLEGNRRNIIKDLKASNNELNKELADLVKKGGRETAGATIIKTVTKFDTTYKTVTRWDTVRAWDTLERLDTFYLWPVYDSYFKNRWIDLKISATHDTTKTDLTIYNDFDIIHTRKRRDLVIYVKNKNPYTKAEAIKSVAIRRKRRRLGVGVHAGVGVDINGQIVPNAGLSASYHLFQF